MKLKSKLGSQDKVGQISSREIKHSLSDEQIITLALKQYNNPLLAALREICITNPCDAHIDAGLFDTDFDIDVEIDSVWFTIKITVSDYGKGMSTDFLVNEYFSIGRSTKRESAYQSGAFGLGAKCGLIVSDVMRVKSVYQGVETIIDAQLVDGNKIVVSNPVVEKTDKRSGTQVTLNIAYDSVNKYDSDVKEYLRWLCCYVGLGSVFNGKANVTIKNMQNGNYVNNINFEYTNLGKVIGKESEGKKQTNCNYPALHSGEDSLSMQYRTDSCIYFQRQNSSITSNFYNESGIVWHNAFYKIPNSFWSSIVNSCRDDKLYHKIVEKLGTAATCSLAENEISGRFGTVRYLMLADQNYCFDITSDRAALTVTAENRKVIKDIYVKSIINLIDNIGRIFSDDDFVFDFSNVSFDNLIMTNQQIKLSNIANLYVYLVSRIANSLGKNDSRVQRANHIADLLINFRRLNMLFLNVVSSIRSDFKSDGDVLSISPSYGYMEQHKNHYVSAHGTFNNWLSGVNGSVAKSLESYRRYRLAIFVCMEKHKTKLTKYIRSLRNFDTLSPILFKVVFLNKELNFKAETAKEKLAEKEENSRLCNDIKQRLVSSELGRYFRVYTLDEVETITKHKLKKFKDYKREKFIPNKLITLNSYITRWARESIEPYDLGDESQKKKISGILLKKNLMLVNVKNFSIVSKHYRNSSNGIENFSNLGFCLEKMGYHLVGVRGKGKPEFLLDNFNCLWFDDFVEDSLPNISYRIRKEVFNRSLRSIVDIYNNIISRYSKIANLRGLSVEDWFNLITGQYLDDQNMVITIKRVEAYLKKQKPSDAIVNLFLGSNNKKVNEWSDGIQKHPLGVLKYTWGSDINYNFVKKLQNLSVRKLMVMKFEPLLNTPIYPNYLSIIRNLECGIDEHLRDELKFLNNQRWVAFEKQLCFFLMV